MIKKESYKRALSVKFDTQIKSGKTIFKKIDSPHIVLYEWEDGRAYSANYKCLPALKKMKDMCDYIESNIPFKKKRGEYYLFLDTLNKIELPKNVEIRLLNYQDEKQLENLKAACDSKECEIAQIMIYDIHVLGAFVNHTLVGVSSIIELFNAYDIGILVHPQHRRQGISSALVYENTLWAQAQEKLCMYRCDDNNIGSYKSGLKVGFKKEVDIIIYDLKEELPYVSD